MNEVYSHCKGQRSSKWAGVSDNILIVTEAAYLLVICVQNYHGYFTSKKADLGILGAQ